MTRPYCLHVGSCTAGRRGRCRTCQPLSPEVRARHAAAMKAAMAAKRGFEIPGWVRAAGLEDDYVSIGEEFGEEYAAAHCRRLKRGMATASEAA